MSTNLQSKENQNMIDSVLSSIIRKPLFPYLLFATILFLFILFIYSIHKTGYVKFFGLELGKTANIQTSDVNYEKLLSEYSKLSESYKQLYDILHNKLDTLYINKTLLPPELGKDNNEIIQKINFLLSDQRIKDGDYRFAFVCIAQEYGKKKRIDKNNCSKDLARQIQVLLKAFGKYPHEIDGDITRTFMALEEYEKEKNVQFPRDVLGKECISQFCKDLEP